MFCPTFPLPLGHQDKQRQHAGHQLVGELGQSLTVRTAVVICVLTSKLNVPCTLLVAEDGGVGVPELVEQLSERSVADLR